MVCEETVEAELVVTNKHGLHARPAVEVVRKAATFKADIRIRNLTRCSEFYNAKSLTDLLLAAVDPGHRIKIVVAGEDARDALMALTTLIKDIGERKD